MRIKKDCLFILNSVPLFYNINESLTLKYVWRINVLIKNQY